MAHCDYNKQNYTSYHKCICLFSTFWESLLLQLIFPLQHVPKNEVRKMRKGGFQLTPAVGSQTWRGARRRKL